MWSILQVELNHGHAGEFIIECSQSEGLGSQLADFSHGLVNSRDQGGQGLIRTFSDAEKVIIGIESHSWFLLDMDRSKLRPHSHWVILYSFDVGPLFFIYQQIQLPTCSGCS